MFKKVKINFDWSIFLEADYSTHTGSCITHQQNELKDIHEAYGGFPDSYIFHNTIIHQLWWDRNQIDFDNLEKQLDMEVITVSSILQPPGNIIPLHKDTFYQINKKYPDDKRMKVRANIYLEDWKMGHIIQYNNHGTWHTDINWKSGDGLLWDSEILHVGANIGFDNKMTLQISGFLNE